jgi:hypothetical protein
MQKLSIKNLSILGLVLTAASAVTAAVLPSKSEKKAVFLQGSLTQISEFFGAGPISSITCEPDTYSAIANMCNVTVNNPNQQLTETSEQGFFNNSDSYSSFFEMGGGPGGNNTSDYN